MVEKREKEIIRVIVENSILRRDTDAETESYNGKTKYDDTQGQKTMLSYIVLHGAT